MKTKEFIWVLGALLLLAPAAKASNLTASGEGWCSNSMDCDNTDTSAIDNTYAGSDGGGDLFQDWFAFQLPSSPITNASVSIFNDGQDFNADLTAFYTLFEASSFTYGGLASGTAFGSVSVSAADTGTSHYVTIDLNAAGITALNGDLGNTFIFGGAGDLIPVYKVTPLDTTVVLPHF